MDSTILVGPDISAGRKLMDALENDLRLEAVFWLMEEDAWRLVLVTPLVHEQGPHFVYSRVLDFFESTAVLTRDLFRRIEVVSPTAGMVRALDPDREGQVPLDRIVLNESVNGTYVAGAYFYKFAPKTFAKAS